MDLPVKITTGEIEVVIVADVVDGVSVRQKKKEIVGSTYQFSLHQNYPYSYQCYWRIALIKEKKVYDYTYLLYRVLV